MEARVTWKDGLSFDGTAETGFTLPLGAKPEVGGKNDGFRPMELLLLGLAACTAMDVVSILKKKQQEITSFEVQVKGDRAETHPKVFTFIDLHFIVAGWNVDPAAVARAIELSSTKYCSAQAMLKEAVTIETRFTIQPAEA